MSAPLSALAGCIPRAARSGMPTIARHTERRRSFAMQSRTHTHVRGRRAGRRSALRPLMNIFTTEAYLDTAGALFYPRRDRRREICAVEGRRIPLLVLDGEEVVGRMPFYDYPQPLDDAKGPIDRQVAYLPRTVLRTVPMELRTP